MNEEDRACGIYVITEIETGKQYVGQTRCKFIDRWKNHRRRFPPETHTYEVLTTCQVSELDRLERRFIEELGTRYPKGHNFSKGGNRTWSRVWTIEQRKSIATRQSLTMKERWKTEKYRKLFSEASKKSCKKVWSREDHRKRVSESCKRTWSNEQLRHMQSERVKSILSRPDMKKLWSDKAKKLWQNDSYRELIKKKCSDAWSDPDKRYAASLRQKNIKKEVVACPHCKKEGGKPTMKRWHFENCKKK
jgi:hypothetical protein